MSIEGMQKASLRNVLVTRVTTRLLFNVSRNYIKYYMISSA